MPEDIQHLHAKGVFEFLEKSHLDTLISVFLERVYPLYPTVSRQELIQQHNKGEIPLILLHSISFIAVTFCPLSVLHLVGFSPVVMLEPTFTRRLKPCLILDMK